MPENTSFPLIETTVSENTVVSPAVAAIVEKAHLWATEIIERFAANEINPFRYYLREANATIAYILGKQTNPADFSRVIALKKEYRVRQAVNDASFETQEAA